MAGAAPRRGALHRTEEAWQRRTTRVKKMSRGGEGAMRAAFEEQRTFTYTPPRAHHRPSVAPRISSRPLLLLSHVASSPSSRSGPKTRAQTPSLSESAPLAISCFSCPEMNARPRAAADSEVRFHRGNATLTLVQCVHIAERFVVAYYVFEHNPPQGGVLGGCCLRGVWLFRGRRRRAETQKKVTLNLPTPW